MCMGPNCQCEDALCCWYSGSAIGPTTNVAMPCTEVIECNYTVCSAHVRGIMPRVPPLVTWNAQWIRKIRGTRDSQQIPVTPSSSIFQPLGCFHGPFLLCCQPQPLLLVFGCCNSCCLMQQHPVPECLLLAPQCSPAPCNSYIRHSNHI
jgi:hypothetical protein